MLFSVVVPAFNAERSIYKCLNSILNQAFYSFEVIVVDDGSTDNTKNIISEIKAKNKNLIYLYQENRGVSAARNLGLETCKGEYVVFLDSDDYVLDNYLSELAEFIERTGYPEGILLGHWRSSNNKRREVKPYHLNGRETHEEKEALLFKGLINNCPWDKVFKRELFLLENIWFMDGITVGEDALVTHALLLNSKSMQSFDKSFVVYVDNAYAVTKSVVKEKQLIDIVEVLNILSSNCKDVNREYFELFLINSSLHYVKNYPNRDSVYLSRLKRLLEGSIHRVRLSLKWRVKDILKVFVLKVNNTLNLRGKD
ncbi:glycosyltransferase family 2 protein [Paraferrimonas sedimenticola]|uniref:Glycosyltransferase 2-like domain-containing protein n=1 Tax=Paraferrimonas sedimenticola TaxID=375674 RepID=A0AA37RY24_9GAMM|nr:glycosyltransferase family 2 protein [Paraferrimonas sedimenticola]GLP96767.1 hypothetical protein GCM10007895_20730 [Paraferrimonas sedimenticola]